MKLKGDVSWIEINILKRSNSQSYDYWDGNWLDAEIKINIPGFKGLYGTNLRTSDFEYFYNSLKKVRCNQSNEIEFTTMEEGLYLKGILEVAGNIKWNGIAKPSWGNSCLIFAIETDYASINDLLMQVQEILNEYPVIGVIS